MNPREIYAGSDAAATVALYEALRSRGPIGHLAECLWRAQRKSSRAKQYSRRFRSKTYDEKQSSMAQLVKMLDRHGSELGFRYGWKPDPGVLFDSRPSFVLYVDIPMPESGLDTDMLRRGYGIGCQVSFHSPDRGEGPDYADEWDGIPGASVERVIHFANHVLTLPVTEEAMSVFPFGKHRGEPLSEIQEQYLRWALENIKLAPELRDAVVNELSGRA